MIEIKPQEVWFAEFPFAEDATQWKERPVIVLDVDEEFCRVLSMKIISTAPRSEFEIELFDWNKVHTSPQINCCSFRRQKHF